MCRYILITVAQHTDGVRLESTASVGVIPENGLNVASHVATLKSEDPSRASISSADLCFQEHKGLVEA